MLGPGQVNRDGGGGPGHCVCPAIGAQWPIFALEDCPSTETILNLPFILMKKVVDGTNRCMGCLVKFLDG